VFDRRLRELNGQAKNVLGEALKKNSEPALIRSTFDLPAAQRAAIQNALNETFAAEIHLRFETAPELVSGIELSANGQKVGWNIADYLASLEEGVDELLKEKDKPAPGPEIEAASKPEPVPEVETEATPESKPKGETAPNGETTNQPKPGAIAVIKPGPKAELGAEELPGVRKVP
jgi:F-type H+-transporting ATPase subunit b